MLYSQLFLSLCSAAIVTAGSAPEVSDLPTGVTYQATFEKKIDGYVNFTSNSDGQVVVGVDISGLPDYGGPFLYHVHAHTVPTNGNCSGTLGHFNPYNGSDTSTTWSGKEVGDLSGRHGTINGTSISTLYVDPYLSLNTDSKLFFGNLSVVVHFHNTTRIACANITQVVSELTSGVGALKASTGMVILAAATLALAL